MKREKIDWPEPTSININNTLKRKEIGPSNRHNFIKPFKVISLWKERFQNSKSSFFFINWVYRWKIPNYWLDALEVKELSYGLLTFKKRNGRRLSCRNKFFKNFIRCCWFENIIKLKTSRESNPENFNQNSW